MCVLVLTRVYPEGGRRWEGRRKEGGDREEGRRMERGRSNSRQYVACGPSGLYLQSNELNQSKYD